MNGSPFMETSNQISPEALVKSELRQTVLQSETDEIFRLLVDAVEDYAIFALDPQGFIQTWNNGARRLKGYLPEEIIGTHFSRFYTAADIERNHPVYELKQALEKGKYEEEGWRIRKDGSTFWANVVITALKDSRGILRGFGKVTRDLTQRRNAEIALKESEERFRLIIEMTADGHTEEKRIRIGAIEALKKPADIDVILETVGRFCGK